MAALFKTAVNVNASSKRLLVASRGPEPSSPIVDPSLRRRRHLYRRTVGR
jgi:hypothetical protein